MPGSHGIPVSHRSSRTRGLRRQTASLGLCTRSRIVPYHVVTQCPMPRGHALFHTTWSRSVRCHVITRCPMPRGHALSVPRRSTLQRSMSCQVTSRRALSCFSLLLNGCHGERSLQMILYASTCTSRCVTVKGRCKLELSMRQQERNRVDENKVADGRSQPCIW
jgi:hypothetical protein